MNILGFRTNKLWKKIIAVVYYLFCLFITFGFIGAYLLMKDEIIKFGTKQDLFVNAYMCFFIWLLFIIPIIILEMRYRCKLKAKKTVIYFIISFCLWFLFMLLGPNYSEQYNSYLDSKRIVEIKAVQEIELESQESENLLQEIDIKETVNDVIIDDNINQENEININEEIEKEDIEEIVENNKIKEENNIEKVEEIKKDEEVFESIKDKVKESSSVTNEQVFETEITKNEIIEEVIQEPNTEQIIEDEKEVQTESIQNTIIPEATDKKLVWICDTGKKYHSNSSCSRMNYPYQVTKEEAIASGRDACKKCY